MTSKRPGGSGADRRRTAGRGPLLALACTGLLLVFVLAIASCSAIDYNISYAHGYGNTEAVACERAHENADAFAGRCQLEPCTYRSLDVIPDDMDDWEDCNKRLPCYRAAIMIDCPDTSY